VIPLGLLAKICIGFDTLFLTLQRIWQNRLRICIGIALDFHAFHGFAKDSLRCTQDVEDFYGIPQIVPRICNDCGQDVRGFAHDLLRFALNLIKCSTICIGFTRLCLVFAEDLHRVSAA